MSKCLCHFFKKMGKKEIRNKKNLIFAGILVSLTMMMCQAKEKEEMPYLTVPVLFEHEIPKDMDKICEEVQKLVQKKIGVDVELTAILYNTSSSSSDQRQQSELSLLQKQGKHFDVYPSVLSKEGYLELSELLEKNGSKITELIGKRRMEIMKKNGEIWTLPSISDYVSSFGITMRKDFVLQTGIHLNEIKTLQDLSKIFEKIKEEYPDLSAVCSYRTRRGFIDRLKATKIIVDPICVKNDQGKFENYYETKEYEEMVKLFYEWGQNGYLPDALPFQNVMGSSIVKSGTLFSYFSPCKPSIEYEESISCGMDMVTIPLIEPVVTSHSLEGTVHWGISSTCQYPESAMEFLNLLYTDRELVNLIIYGIEGVHYEIMEDGTICYPEGISQENVGYQNTQPWFLPNQLISYVWEGNDPQMWSKTKQFNEEARWQEGITFEFETNTVKAEIENIEQVLEKYTYGLESGQLDPEIYLTRMRAELKKAGSDHVLEEVQRQWDAEY